ncbi:acyl-CoA thioesterase [Afifella pfennigii]|uniref:acyl-CoA thioesterase n=1 Tax=Afifella pfennigii TaxID=209897 RepID=UPI00047CED8F|nr:hotdog domain-containing protein [Afifella pfennigii]
MAAERSPQGEARFLEMILPQHGGHAGTLCAADALQIMARAASVCASRHARCAVITAKADEIDFLRSIRVGSVVEVRARIVFQGRSSMTVIVEIVPDDPGKREHVPSMTGRFMMLAVDSDGTPIPITASRQACPEETPA